MLVLFESPGGFAIFKLLDESKLHETENLFKEFETPEKASKVVKLKHFQKFQDMTEAVNAAASLIEGKMTKNLKKLLKKVVAKEAHEQLAVADAKLGSLFKDKLSLSCVANSSVQELMRCIRSQMDSLISEMPKKEMAAMALGLAHGLSRYKLKFSPDKIDTMIIQAVSLLDDLDKELNNYIMRCKEWYGWHFPELAKVISDNRLLVQTIKLLGLRSNAAEADLSELLSEDVEKKVKELAEVSMGTEISDDDLINILHLCNEILEMSLYRTQLFDYIKNRMMAVAPNLTVLVGELVGARLISHAGSLINLAKHPASTVQILGAEKALFRALKTKHDTPKYGLIYHAQLISQTNQKMKGKLSRMLAAKSALAVRVDALGDDSSCTLGMEHKAKLEARLKQLEEGGMRRISGTGKTKAKWEKYDNQSEVHQYKAEDDSTLPHQQGQKRKHEFGGDAESPFHATKRVKQEEPEGDPSTSQMSKKKKKKIKKDPEGEEQEEMPDEGPSIQQPKKKKIKKEKEEEEETSLVLGESMDPETPEKKKKKKKKKKVEEEEDE